MADNSKSSAPRDRQEASPIEGRRAFLAKIVAGFVGLAALAVPTASGVVAFFDPLRRKSAGEKFYPLAPFDSLAYDGSPRRVSVIAERADAWNKFPNEAIGAVFLRRVGKDKVEALQTVCPHMGCSILFEAEGEGGRFHCPCHNASFDLTGRRTDAVSSAPRDMDPLETEIRDGVVWVKFRTFPLGVANRS